MMFHQLNRGMGQAWVPGQVPVTGQQVGLAIMAGANAPGTSQYNPAYPAWSILPTSQAVQTPVVRVPIVQPVQQSISTVAQPLISTPTPAPTTSAPITQQVSYTTPVAPIAPISTYTPVAPTPPPVSTPPPSVSTPTTPTTPTTNANYISTEPLAPLAPLPNTVNTVPTNPITGTTLAQPATDANAQSTLARVTTSPTNPSTTGSFDISTFLGQYGVWIAGGLATWLLLSQRR